MKTCGLQCRRLDSWLLWVRVLRSYCGCGVPEWGAWSAKRTSPYQTSITDILFTQQIKPEYIMIVWVLYKKYTNHPEFNNRLLLLPSAQVSCVILLFGSEHSTLLHIIYSHKTRIREFNLLNCLFLFFELSNFYRKYKLNRNACSCGICRMFVSILLGLHGAIQHGDRHHDRGCQGKQSVARRCYDRVVRDAVQ